MSINEAIIAGDFDGELVVRGKLTVASGGASSGRSNMAACWSKRVAISAAKLIKSWRTRRATRRGNAVYRVDLPGALARRLPRPRVRRPARRSPCRRRLPRCRRPIDRPAPWRPPSLKPNRLNRRRCRTSTPPAPRIAAVIAPPPPPARLIGLGATEVSKLLGVPARVRRERRARIWQYVTKDCVLDLFLYPAAGGHGHPY